MATKCGSFQTDIGAVTPMANLRTVITSRLPRFLRWTLECGQRFGVNITPNHFYSEIPNFRHLRSTDYWRKPMTMQGILGSDTGPQIAASRACTEPYLDVLQSRNIHEEASRLNDDSSVGASVGDLLFAI